MYTGLNWFNQFVLLFIGQKNIDTFLRWFIPQSFVGSKPQTPRVCLLTAPGEDQIPDWRPAEDGAEEEGAGGEPGRSDGGGGQAPGPRSDQIRFMFILWAPGPKRAARQRSTTRWPEGAKDIENFNLKHMHFFSFISEIWCPY